MFKQHCLITLLSLITSLGLLACGGIDGTGAPLQSAATSGSASINSAKSDELIVNGLTFSSDKASISIDGREGEIKAGQVVVVKSQTLPDGDIAQANNIFALSNVIGTIDAVDAQDASFNVLGQRVIVDSATILGEGLADFSTLQAGLWVRVSGFTTSQKEIQATRIEWVEAQDYQVVGVVEAHSQDLTIFSINELDVDYSAQTELSLLDGAAVLVRGANLLDGVLTAQSIEIINPSLGAENTQVSLEGLVTQFSSEQVFSVNGVSIVATSRTLFENADDESNNIHLDARLLVEGTMTNAGAIDASRITIIHTQAISFRGQINTEGSEITYTIKSSEVDKGLWVTLDELDNGAYLHVYRVSPQGHETRECARWALNSFNEGLCYVTNDQSTQWKIKIGRSGASESETSFRLRAYFRRANHDSEELIQAGESIDIDHREGDRNFYRISTENAPKGSFLAVRVDGLQNSGWLYIQGDDNSSEASLFDCSLGNKTFDPENGFEFVQRIC